MKRAALAAALLLLPACGSGPEDARAQGAAVTVFAASSLNEALPALTAAFGAGHEGRAAEVSFAGSQSLVAQVRQGAPADLVVTADRASMDALRDRLDGEPVVLARNALAVVTEAGDPKGVRSLADLARPDVTVVLAGPDVPAGRAARRALRAAGVRVAPASEEPDVRAVLGRVRLGEADAGVVYVTDLRSAGDDVGGFALPGAVNEYLGAVVRDADDAAAARDLLDFIASPAGQRVLAGLGFLPP